MKKNPKFKNVAKRTACFFTVLFIVSSFFPVSFFSVCADAPREESPGFDGYLVYVDRPFSEPETAALAALEETATLEEVMDGVFRVPTYAEAQRLLDDGIADQVEPDYLVELWDDVETVDVLAQLYDSDIPSKESANPKNGWAYDAVSAHYAEEYRLDGRGVRIAIIDSGIDQKNPDLQGARIRKGMDFADGVPNYSGSMYHGTNVSQIIAADFNALGGTGIAPEAELVDLRCFSTVNGGKTSKLAQAIMAAVDIYDCDIINMSWGLTQNAEVLRRAIRYAYQKGVILVAAGGNVSASMPQGTLVYPAAYPEVIGVGAVDSSLSVLRSSMNTEAVSVFAPGGAIPFCSASGEEQSGSGTSYACPHVSAMLALLRQLAPFLDPAGAAELIHTRAEPLGTQATGLVPVAGFARIDQLLRNSWSMAKWTSPGEGGNASTGSLELRAWLLHRGGGIYIAALYSKNGKMRTLSIVNQTEDVGVSVCTLDDVLPEDRVALIYVDERISVLSDCDRFLIPEGGSAQEDVVTLFSQTPGR